jgi:hypothetical protein
LRLRGKIIGKLTIISFLFEARRYMARMFL